MTRVNLVTDTALAAAAPPRFFGFIYFPQSETLGGWTQDIDVTFEVMNGQWLSYQWMMPPMRLGPAETLFLNVTMPTFSAGSLQLNIGLAFWTADLSQSYATQYSGSPISSDAVDLSTSGWVNPVLIGSDLSVVGNAIQSAGGGVYYGSVGVQAEGSGLLP